MNYNPFDLSEIPLHIELSEHAFCFYMIQGNELKNNKYFIFTKHQILLLNQLYRFRYFNKEIYDNLYKTFKGSMDNNWFYTWHGSRSYPFSVFSASWDKRVKLYYCNKPFVEWLKYIFDSKPFLNSLRDITESRPSHSIASIRYIGGKPKNVNQHDFNTRVLASRVLKELHPFFKHDTTLLSSLQLSFPVTRKSGESVADATIFVKEKEYHIEYDNMTESQSKIVAKLLGYSRTSSFQNRIIFFAFRNNKKKGIERSERVDNFLNLAEDLVVNGKTIMQQVHEHNINVVALPVQNFAEQTARNIALDYLSLSAPYFSFETLQESSMYTHEILSFDSETFGPFCGMVTCLNSDFIEETIPLIYLRYGWLGEEHRILNILKKYQSKYPTIGLLEDKDTFEHYFKFKNHILRNLPTYSVSDFSIPQQHL